MKKLFSYLALFVCTAAPAAAQSVTLIETATVGGPNDGTAYVVGTRSVGGWYGTTFHVTTMTDVSQVTIGGLSGFDGIAFVAIVKVPSNPGPFNDADVITHATFTPVSGDTNVPLPMTLPPGDYRLAFGCGHFGATCTTGAIAASGYTATGSPELFWIDSNGIWVALNPSIFRFRFVVAGLLDIKPQFIIDGIDTAVNTRASQTSVNTLTTNVGTLTTNVGMLSTAVSGKASQSSVDGLGVSIGAALTAIATKSSQSSVDTVSTKVDTKASQSSLDALNASVATQTQVSNLGTSVNTANTTLASLGLAVAALPQHADLASVQSTVLGQIGTRASQASVDALSSALGTNGDLGVKLEIERALIDGKRIVSFVLPESVGGHLERVRDIVDELLTDGQAAGFDVTKARAHFAKAETARTAGDYKTAYDEYAAAYQALIK